MRKITNESVNAFLNAKNFRKANMEVVLADDGSTVKLLLHGNKIAWYKKGTSSIFICSGGWCSNTTKERLNSLPKVYIKQKQGVWYLNGNVWYGNEIEISLNNQVL